MTAANPTIDTVSAYNRLRETLSSADERHFNLGARWYADARQTCRDMSIEFNIPFRTVCAIVATFSATMPWERNIPAARIIMQAWNDGIRDYRKMPAVTRNHMAVRKACDMLHGASPMDTIVKRQRPHVQSWKTLVFYMNISGISTRRCTIDVWMWRILTGDYNSQYRPEGREFMVCESIVRDVAREYNVRPCDLQAIAWMAVVDKPA